MSCDPDVQYKIVLILQSDWTRLSAGALHKLMYGRLSVAVACEQSGNETNHRSAGKEASDLPSTSMVWVVELTALRGHV